MNSRFAKTATTASLIALFTLALTGCASGDSVKDGLATGTEAGSGQSGAPKGGDGDYAFGTERDDMAIAIEKAFSSDNATAKWDGDVLVLALDGDINDIMPGFSECRVLSHLLLETDRARIEFPNGSITCEEALAD